MELSGFLGFQSEREHLWNAIYDTNSWLEAIPAAERCEQIEDNVFEMVVNFDLPVLKGSQTVTIIFSEAAMHERNCFFLENGMIKSAFGSFHIQSPHEALPEDGEDYPAGTNCVLGYRLELDTGNTLFNAALEGLKPKLKQGIEKILLRLEAPALLRGV